MNTPCTKCGTRRLNPFTGHHQCPNGDNKGNTLSEDTIRVIQARIDESDVATVYRRCQVSQETFRRAMLGQSISQSTHRLITKYAKGAS